MAAPPPLAAGFVDAAGVVHAPNTSIDTPAIALSFLKFIQSPPRH
jgi:hypothetical protein